jgi:putative tryptophan/tyrosine transport system ATP-binding protein
MIVLKHIEVTISTATAAKKRILGPINLTIEKGDWIVIVGGNGAGKSTLLNTIAGTLKPSYGSINIGKADVTQLPEYRRATQLARVFQDPGIFPELTIEENMALAYTRTAGRNIIKRDVTTAMRDTFKKALLDLNMGLENRLSTKVSDLSGGQRQALSLIMATMYPSQALLLDEHTSALDPRATKMVMELTQKLIEKYKLTAVMVTHSLQDALMYGNRILVLNQGLITHDIRGNQKTKLTSDQLITLL